MTDKGKKKLKISGKSFELPTVSSMHWKLEERPGGWWIIESENGDRQKFMFHGDSVGMKQRVSFSLKGHLWSGELLQEQKYSQGRTNSGLDAGDLVAQFPGKVRKVLINEGARVSEGDSLILVEAMKMEFSVRAPYSGRVKKLFVQEGQQVSPGDEFIALEKSENENSIS